MSPGAEGSRLEEWGWSPSWAERAALAGVDGHPARVVGQGRDRWVLQTGVGAVAARIVSRGGEAEPPVVGDWVLAAPGPEPADPWSIRAVVQRRSSFARGAAGSGAARQVLAANVDVVWVVHGLDTPVNPRRLERTLAMGWEGGAQPEVVLTKADLAPDLAAALGEVRSLAPGVPVRWVRRDDAATVDALRASLRAGVTVALLGPSGAGKSTLVNLLLDTPGIRELRVWSLDDRLDLTFPEIDALAGACRFTDCRHEREPGCAVLEAVEDGSLDPGRLESFRKLRAEAAYQARRTDPEARRAAVAEHKTALKTLRHHPKYRETR